jgi:hypothetical protein
MPTPHAENNPESTSQTNHPTLAGRRQTWEVLRRDGAVLAWLPRMCDVAMTHFPHAKSAAEVCSSPDFAARCEAHPHPYSGITFNPQRALEALSDPKRILFGRYIQAQFRRLSSQWSFANEQSRLDGRELLEDAYCTYIARYEVGTVTDFGVAVTWGWEAFLAERLVWSVASRLKGRSNYVMEDIASDAFAHLPDWTTDPTQLANLKSTRESVARALAAILTHPRDQAIYRGLVYRGQSYQQLAVEHGGSLGSIGHQVTGPLIDLLQEILGCGGAGPNAKASFRRLREPLARTISEEVFDELMTARLPLHSA